MEQGIREKDVEDFVKCAEKLNKIMERIKKYNPEAHLYAEEESLCLLPCPTHDERGMGNVDKVIASVAICGMDSGAF